jgi:hypothetical protein
MRFGIMGTRLTILGRMDWGPTMGRPTWPRDPGREAHYPRWFKRYLVDKSCKIGK